MQDHTNNHTNKDAILYKPTEPDGLTDHHAVSLRLQAKLFPGPLDYATSTRLQQSLQVHKHSEVWPSRKGGAVIFTGFTSPVACGVVCWTL